MTKQTSQNDIYKIETTANDYQFKARENLARLYKESPLKQDDLLFNLGLYTRGSLLVKYLVLNDIYKLFKHIPGTILEFGTWYGQNLVLLENLRAIHEPFNKQRKIIGFDTFTGYDSVSTADKSSDVWSNASYNCGESYPDYLRNLLKTHEQMNALGHVHDCHEIVVGNVTETVPDYFQKNKHLIVAFAYFDLGIYQPTKAALLAIKPHLVKGSIILMDELTWPESPGEALAFKEVFDLPYEMCKCEHYPSKTIIKVL